jgi:hypothetical protein
VFPSHFFTTISGVALKDYYHIAYGMIKPNIIKILQQPNASVNSVAMMIRFGFGSDISFYHKVF